LVVLACATSVNGCSLYMSFARVVVDDGDVDAVVSGAGRVARANWSSDSDVPGANPPWHIRRSLDVRGVDPRLNCDCGVVARKVDLHARSVELTERLDKRGQPPPASLPAKPHSSSGPQAASIASVRSHAQAEAWMNGNLAMALCCV